jgi:hypothetical protein
MLLTIMIAKKKRLVYRQHKEQNFPDRMSLAEPLAKQPQLLFRYTVNN